MSDDRGVNWLRTMIETRLTLAREADTGDQWEAFRHYGCLWTVDLLPSAGACASAAEAHAAVVGVPDADPWEDPRFLPAWIDHAQHIAANGPASVIAQCESHLDLLAWADTVVKRASEGRDAALVAGVCESVRGYVARAYRHEGGYAQHWEGADT